jgi:hypothetical protein
VSVVALVERERAWVGRLITGWGIGIAVAGACAALGLGVFAFGQGRWMELPAPLPIVAWVLVAAFVGLAASLTARRLAAEATRRRVALAIEHDRVLRRGALRGALEVGDTGALGRRGAEQLRSRIADGKALSPTLRGKARLRTAAVAVLATAAIATLTAAALTVPDGWTALAHPVRAWRGTLLPPLRIDAPSDVARGQPVHVRIAAPGRLRVAVQRRVTGASWTTGWFRVIGGYARFTTGPVDADLSMVATDERAVSDTVTVRAVDRPFVGGVALTAEYPSYLHRPREVLPAGEDARVPRGTRIELVGSASTDLAGVALVRSDRSGGGETRTDSVALHCEARRFSGRLVADLWAAGRWEWRAAGMAGPITDVPAALQLEVIPDSAPTVEILAPAHDTVVGSGEKLVLALQASDDHGLSEVVLRSHRVPATGAPGADAIQRVIDSAGPRWMGNATLDLGSRGLQPGDALRVRAEVTDNSPWRQRGASRDLVLRVPSLTEQRALVRSAADSTVAQVAAAAAAQRQLEQRTEDAARERGPRQSTAPSSSPTSPTSQASRGGGPGTPAQGSLPYETAEQARALSAQQRQLASRVDSLRKQTQQLQRQLQQAGALDSGLASRLSEAQRLLSDALTPELRAQLDQLDQRAASLSGGDTRQSLGDLAQQQQRMRDQLDKTVDVLKRAALEGSMQTLRDEARDIAKAERSAPQQTSGGAPTQPPPTDRQLTERSRDLSRDVDKLAKRLAAAQASTGAREVGAAREHVDSSAQAMQGRNQQTAATEMDRAAQQLGDARQAQVDEWKSALTNELDRSIQETMQLAQRERELARTAQAAPSAQSPAGGPVDKSQLEAEQSAVQQGTDRASERLQRAGRQSALISAGAQRAVGEARAKVQQATQELRDPQGASGGTGAAGAGGQQSAAAMRDAAQALTDAAAALVRDRERAASASSSSGLAEMLQQMRQLAEQQGQLNAQAQGFSLMPGAGGRKAGQGGGPAQQLANGERQVAKSLDEVGQGDAGGGADALAREARQIAEALERSGLDSATIARQQRLYHRLLDAGHTLEQDQRDSTGKRESQAATGSDAFAPTNTSAEGRAAMKYPEPTWAELRDLSTDERQIVIDYFKRINANPNAEP